MLLTTKTRSAFHTLLDARALAEDAADAIIFVETERPSTHISRLQLRQQVGRYAAALEQIGIGAGDVVIIAHTQNLASIYAFWGALWLGAVPSMFPTLTEKLDPQVYLRNMAELVRLSQVRAVLTTDAFAPALRAVVDCPVLGEAEIEQVGVEAAVEMVRPEANQIAFLQHSSGTTGLQKGVALAHTAVLNQLAAYSEAIQLTEQDMIVSWLPLYHDMGLIAGFLLPLMQGIPLVLISPFDWVQHPALLLQAISQYGGTLCWLPNFAYNHCARRIRQRDLADWSLAGMRLFINCSEPVRHDSHQLFLTRFAELGVTPEMLGVSYAMAENTFAVTQTAPGQPVLVDVVDGLALRERQTAVPIPADSPQAMTLVSCGPPIAGTEVAVWSAEGAALPERRVGELVVRSNCMLTEYYRREDLRPFQDGWFRTGDMGYMADGQVYVIGRAKDVIINAGKNIYPQDIEAIVNQIPGVHVGRCVVFGVPDEREGTELIAVVAEVDTAVADERKRINQEIRKRVAAQSMVTVSYVQLVDAKWLLKTSSGKIARAANRDKWLSLRDG